MPVYNVSMKYHYSGARNKRLKQLSEQVGEPICGWLRRRYVEELATYRELANELSINFRTVMRIMDACKIEPRSPSEAVKAQWIRKPERRASQAERIRKLRKGGPGNPCPEWLKQKLSQERQGIDNPMYNRCGPLHPQWKGGKIWWRGKEWHILKLTIRERDQFICQSCGITEQEHIEQYGQPLQVHHIIPYRISHDNNPNNLITLCVVCHTVADKKTDKDLPLLFHNG